MRQRLGNYVILSKMKKLPKKKSSNDNGCNMYLKKIQTDLTQLQRNKKTI